MESLKPSPVRVSPPVAAVGKEANGCRKSFGEVMKYLLLLMLVGMVSTGSGLALGQQWWTHGIYVTPLEVVFVLSLFLQVIVGLKVAIEVPRGIGRMMRLAASLALLAVWGPVALTQLVFGLDPIPAAIWVVVWIFVMVRLRGIRRKWQQSLSRPDTPQLPTLPRGPRPPAMFVRDNDPAA